MHRFFSRNRKPAAAGNAANAASYRAQRRADWDGVSDFKQNPERLGAQYNRMLAHYYRFLVPSGLRVLELGSGHGDLLAALKPRLGVGVDFATQMLATARKRHPHLCFVQADAHQIAFKTTFDVIILSDLVNDLWDVQQVFEVIRAHCHERTRVILNFYNNLWRLPLRLARRSGVSISFVEQNWFSPHDVANLLDLAGFEIVSQTSRILFPLYIKYLSGLLNRFLCPVAPFSWLALTNFMVARPLPAGVRAESVRVPSVSVVVAARNEAGNIDRIVREVPAMGSRTELIFVEGHSHDATYEIIQKKIDQSPDRDIRLFKQPGKGKGDAVRTGFENAQGEVLMILDADLTVAPGDLPRFYRALTSGKGDFINGVRLVYPMQDRAMRFFNILGNKFFSLAFSWLLGQPIKDTLCGTKVLWKQDYELIAANRSYFGNFDPFGDYDLLFGAAKLNFKIIEMPIRYRARTYGDTNIKRWRHGWLLLRMVYFAARRIKFV